MYLYLSVNTASSSGGGEMSALTTATQSFNSSVDVPTTSFIAQGRRRGDGQDVDNTTNSSDTQYVLSCLGLERYW